MKKIGQKEIIQAILNEALTIKRKRELFKEAKKINSELKQLNEYGHPPTMLGPGFENSTTKMQLMGLSTPINVSPDEKEHGEDCGCKLDQFDGLEKDMEEFGDEESTEDVSGEETSSEGGDDIQALKDENQELKAQLAQIKNAVESLNEGVSGNVAKAAQNNN